METLGEIKDEEREVARSAKAITVDIVDLTNTIHRNTRQFPKFKVISVPFSWQIFSFILEDLNRIKDSDYYTGTGFIWVSESPRVRPLHAPWHSHGLDDRSSSGSLRLPGCGEVWQSESRWLRLGGWSRCLRLYVGPHAGLAMR